MANEGVTDGRDQRCVEPAPQRSRGRRPERRSYEALPENATELSLLQKWLVGFRTLVKKTESQLIDVNEDPFLYWSALTHIGPK